MTFARGLRAILRQDPDVVMVGEIRDLETAEIAVQASLTGHLVMSTLHTNTAVGAVTRLVDMGVEPFLLATSLVGVLAQRLVRVLCPDCREQVRADSFECQFLGIDYARAPTIYRGAGCELCGHSGFRGRIGIYELIVVDDALRERIHDRASEQELTRHVRANLPGHSRRRPRQGSERRDHRSGNPPRHAGRLIRPGRLRVHRSRRQRPPEEGRDRSRQRAADSSDAARSGACAAVGRCRNRSRTRPFGATLAMAPRHVGTRPRAVHATDVHAARQRRFRSRRRLRAVAQQTEKPHISTMVMGIRSRVLEGHSLASSLGAFPSAFSHLYRSTVMAGEQSGHLDSVLENLANYTERRYESTRNVEMAMFYPAILFLLAVGSSARCWCMWFPISFMCSRTRDRHCRG